MLNPSQSNKSVPGPVARHFKRFSVNVGLQISSQLLPLVAGALTIPLVYANISRVDFGVFTVALSMLGLFSLLDLGLGRATVRFMARAFAVDDAASAASIMAHSALLLGGFSCVACAAFVLAIPLITQHWFLSSAIDQPILRGSLLILAIALPMTGLTSVFRAVLESRERFLVISIIQVVLGVSTYVVPLLLSFVTRDVRVLIGGAVTCRGLAFVAFLLTAASVWQDGFPWRDLNRGTRKEFQSFSLWLVISNVVGSVIVYGDRAILVKMFGLTEIAFYNIPLEMLGRLMIIVNSAATVVFPALSRAGAKETSFDALYVSLVVSLAAIVGAAFLAVSILTPMGLELWLGAEFRGHSSLLIRIFLVGLAFQTLNVFALATLNARGFARPITTMHLLETPLYFWALYIVGQRAGLPGVACVWSGRLIVEYLCFVGFQISNSPRSQAGRRLTGGAVAAGNILPLALFPMIGNVTIALASSACCILLSFVWAWSRSVRPQV